MSGREPASDAAVLLQPHQGGGPAFRGHLVIQQAAQPLEYDLAAVEERHLVLQLVVLPAKLQVEGLAQDLEVLLHLLVRLLRGGRVDARECGLELAPLGQLVRERGIGDALIELGQPLARAFLRRVLKLHREQLVGVGVALLDPRLLGGSCGFSRRGRTAQCAHGNRNAQAGHSRSWSGDNGEAGDIIGIAATALRERSGARRWSPRTHAASGFLPHGAG